MGKIETPSPSAAVLLRMALLHRPPAQRQTPIEHPEMPSPSNLGKLAIRPHCPAGRPLKALFDERHESHAESRNRILGGCHEDMELAAPW